MIIYTNTADGFREDVDTNQLVPHLKDNFRAKLGFVPNDSETNSWLNSLRFMETVVRRSNVPGDCGVLVEYVLPASSKRIDFVLAGHDGKGIAHSVIIELKQWQEAEPASAQKADMVQTFLGGARRDVTHPSYQAWSYRQFLSNMNSALHNGKIRTSSCAYLHNFQKREPEPLLGIRYQRIIEESPLFFAGDVLALQSYLKVRTEAGKGISIVHAIESGKTLPSPKLIEALGAMYEGNEAFILLDEQKVALEEILSQAFGQGRHTIIVQGGPGTGKSVVAISALVGILRGPDGKGRDVRFVAPNASFRNVVLQTLVKRPGAYRGEAQGIRQLFSGSSSFYGAVPLSIDCLVVDEAHRLKGKGAYMYKGDDQVVDIVRASRVNIFFVDDAQKIRPDDIGSVETITAAAKVCHSELHHVELVSQFRCAGAEGFINWLDVALQIKQTANFDGWDVGSFEFQIMDTPQQVVDQIAAKHHEGYKARTLAGFAWEWSKDTRGMVKDVSMDEFDFAMPWNARDLTSDWAINPMGIDQIGCVHTSQGLEFDYVGVLVGNDLGFNSTTTSLFSRYGEYKDTTGKKGLAQKPDELTTFIKRIYKVLMSRGQRGCFVFFRDPELKKHFQERLSNRKNRA